ncbi:MAG: thioredoxin domain-containing protein [Polyangiaceae bacterium]|nr:thioredoxin domain-containing protein [Myxococcales bacterium]MCB9587753.1 thioredoxin domain-containing protein [Polyangiaceae bacterium]
MAKSSSRLQSFPQGFGVAVLLAGLLACKNAQKPEDLGPDPGSLPQGTVPVGTAPLGTTPVAAPLVPAVAAPTSHATACIPITAEDTTTGSGNALVTLVEFTDLQCPFCSRAQKTLETLRTNYNENELRIVVKHNPLPFHKQARDAALAAQAVQQTSGSAVAMKFIGLVMSNQSELPSTDFAPWVLQAGGDTEQFRTAKLSTAVSAKVDADIQQAKALSANGTPAFFINGAKLSGAQPYEKFQSAIEAEIKETQKLKGTGTAPDQLYVARCRENLGTDTK